MTSPMMENYNYWNDARVRAGMMRAPFTIVSSDSRETVVKLEDGVLELFIENEVLPEGHDGRFSMRTRYALCDICEGAGTMVNPSVDASGWQSDDDLDDEAYFSGRYDVTCSRCRGKRAVLNPIFPVDIQKAIDEWYTDEAAYVQTCADERAMGC